MDGALYGPLIEKLWAKINGSYEKTAAGWQHEALRVLSGAPAYDYCRSVGLILIKFCNTILKYKTD